MHCMNKLKCGKDVIPGNIISLVLCLTYCVSLTAELKKAFLAHFQDSCETNLHSHSLLEDK